MEQTDESGKEAGDGDHPEAVIHMIDHVRIREKQEGMEQVRCDWRPIFSNPKGVGWIIGKATIGPITDGGARDHDHELKERSDEDDKTAETKRRCAHDGLPSTGRVAGVRTEATARMTPMEGYQMSVEGT